MTRRPALLLYANAGLFCDGYILSSIGIALVALQPRFHLDPTSTGLIAGATLFGIMVGAPVFGHLTDRHGRRILMIADLALFVVVCIAQAFVSNVWELIALRFILGLAIGADYPIAAALIGEWIPGRGRGAAVNSMQVAWFLGAAVAYVAGYALLRAAGSESWRWILASPALFAAVALLLRASAPESPLWLASRDAGAIARARFSAIFGAEHRGALAFVSAMWLLQVVPLFAIYAFAPAVLAALGLRDQSSPAGSVAITAAFPSRLASLVAPRRALGTAPALHRGLRDRRRGIRAASPQRSKHRDRRIRRLRDRDRCGGGPRADVSGRALSDPIRATATGFSAAVSRVGAFVGTFALPSLLAHYGIGNVVKGALVLSAIGLFVALRWAPETKGRQLT